MTSTTRPPPVVAVSMKRAKTGTRAEEPCLELTTPGEYFFVGIESHFRLSKSGRDLCNSCVGEEGSQNHLPRKWRVCHTTYSLEGRPAALSSLPRTLVFHAITCHTQCLSPTLPVDMLKSLLRPRLWRSSSDVQKTYTVIRAFHCLRRSHCLLATFCAVFFESMC